LGGRFVEIADIRLTSPLPRLQWMADDLGDTLRASLARPGVALLRPRHPASTKEERLLRVMGLSSPAGTDAAAGLACSPILVAVATGRTVYYPHTEGPLRSRMVYAR
jgi:hypothetical protein